MNVTTLSSGLEMVSFFMLSAVLNEKVVAEVDCAANSMKVRRTCLMLARLPMIF